MDTINLGQFPIDKLNKFILTLGKFTPSNLPWVSLDPGSGLIYTGKVYPW